MGATIARNELKSGIWDADINAHPEVKSDEFEVCGYQCRIHRNTAKWVYNGYVQLPKTHPDYKKTYRELEEKIIVHGDLTYGEGGCFGFDCGHMLMGDISPVDETMREKNPDMFPSVDPIFLGGQDPHYWAYEEVVTEITSMAKQFKARE